MTERSLRVLHLAAYLRRTGGVASVVRTYEAASLPGKLTFTARSTVTGSLCLPADLTTLRTVAAVLRHRREYDVAHVHVTQRGSFIREGMLVRMVRAAGRPVVVTVHGSSFTSSAARHARLAAWALSSAAEVLCLTEAASALVADLPGRPPPVAVIGNPVDDDVRDDRELPGAPTALFLGEVGLRKGVDRLAEAWARVTEAIPSARLQIAGPVAPDGRPSLARLLAMPGVTHHGEVAPGRVGELIRASWLTVLPSRAEALPRAVLETMAAGRAVVATDVGEVRSVVDHHTGVLVNDPQDLGNALIALLSDADRVTRLGSAGRRRIAESFSLPDHLRRLAEVYDRAVASSSLRHAQ